MLGFGLKQKADALHEFWRRFVPTFNLHSCLFHWSFDCELVSVLLESWIAYPSVTQSTKSTKFWNQGCIRWRIGVDSIHDITGNWYRHNIRNLGRPTRYYCLVYLAKALNLAWKINLSKMIQIVFWSFLWFGYLVCQNQIVGALLSIHAVQHLTC